MAKIIHEILQEPVEGYDIGCEQICLVKPCGKRNFYSNPRFGLDTGDVLPATFSFGTHSIMQVSNRAFVGGRSIRVDMTADPTPNLTTRRGAQFLGTGHNLTVGETYTFSAWVNTSINHEVILTTLGGFTAMIEHGRATTIANTWVRVSGKITATFPTQSFYLLFSLESPSLPLLSDMTAYIDGIQIEEGDLTTYLDGDIAGAQDDDYIWVGPQHGSASIRSARAHGGGTEKSLCEYGANLVSLGGFNKGSTTIGGNELAVIGGQSVDSIYHGARTIAMGLGWCGKPEQIRKSKSEFINDLNPNRSLNPRPTRLVFKQTDSNCNPICETVYIDVFCEAGFDAPIVDNYNERYDVILRAPKPNFIQQSNESQPINVQDIVTGNLLCYGEGIGWQAIDSQLPLEEFQFRGPNIIMCGGELYAYGANVSTFDPSVYRWNGSTWNPVGTLFREVYAMDCGIGNMLYAAVQNGGFFRWLGNTWEQLPALFMLGGSNANVIFNDVIVHPNGIVYVFGEFDDVNGIPVNSIAGYDGANWFAVSGPTNGGGVPLITHASLGADGSIYVTGTFDFLPDPGISAINVAQLANPIDGSTWSNMAGGPTVTSEGTEIVECGGVVWAAFEDDNLHVWDGSTWAEVDIGTLTAPNVIGPVHSLSCDCDGETVWAGVRFDNVDDILFGLAMEDGSPVRREAPLTLTGENFNVQRWLCTPDGRIYMNAFSIFDGQPIFVLAPSTSPVCNPGTAKFSDVTVEISGPLLLKEVSNVSTNQKISFDDYIIGAQEVLTINSISGITQVISSARGDLSGTVGLFDVASCRNLGMIPCLNVYSLLVEASPVPNTEIGNSSARVYWQPEYNTAFDGCIDNCADPCCNEGVSAGRDCDVPVLTSITPSTADSGVTTHYTLTGENLSFVYAITMTVNFTFVSPNPTQPDTLDLITQNLQIIDDNTIEFDIGAPARSFGDFSITAFSACGETTETMGNFVQPGCSAPTVNSVTPSVMPAMSIMTFTVTGNVFVEYIYEFILSANFPTNQLSIVAIRPISQSSVEIDVASSGLTGTFDMVFFNSCGSGNFNNAITVVP